VFSRLQRSVDQGVRERAYIFSEVRGTIRRTSALEENQMVAHFQDLFRLAALLRRQSGDVIVLRKHPRSGVLFVPESRAATLVRSWLNINVHLAHQLFPHHRLHPWLQLFLEKVPLFHEYRYLAWGALDNHHLIAVIHQLNQAIVDIKVQMESGPIKVAVAEFIRSANKNRQSLTEYTEALFEEHRTLQVIRLDLGYTDRMTYSARTARNISYDQTNAHRKKLLPYLRRTFQGTLRGYAWKLEHGLQSAFRYHLLLFFAASMSSTDVEIGRTIGEYWSATVTEGKGAYFSWNEPIPEGKRTGTGTIASPTKLRNAVQYMTRIDRYMKLRVPAGGRTFDKGNMPKRKTGPTA
jgi:hypothetical protein